MRYVFLTLLFGTVLAIAPNVAVHAALAKPPGSGGQQQTLAGSWILYDSYDPKTPAFGPFRAEMGCLRLAQTLNEYALDNADDPYVCRINGTPPDEKVTSGGWNVYDSTNTATFGAFATQEPCDQLAKMLNKLAQDEADDPYTCRAGSK